MQMPDGLLLMKFKLSLCIPRPLDSPVSINLRQQPIPSGERNTGSTLLQQ